MLVVVAVSGSFFCPLCHVMILVDRNILLSVINFPLLVLARHICSFFLHCYNITFIWLSTFLFYTALFLICYALLKYFDIQVFEMQLGLDNMH